MRLSSCSAWTVVTTTAENPTKVTLNQRTWLVRLIPHRCNWFRQTWADSKETLLVLYSSACRLQHEVVASMFGQVLFAIQALMFGQWFQQYINHMNAMFFIRLRGHTDHCKLSIVTARQAAWEHFFVPADSWRWVSGLQVLDLEFDLATSHQMEKH